MLVCAQTITVRYKKNGPAGLQAHFYASKKVKVGVHK
jgi:hypothetical protein